MLAGFNGMEAGMGFVMFAFLSFFAVTNSKFDMLAISLPMMGALFGFLLLNRYPSKIFPGDVGTLSIGAALACAVIIGNFEALGFVLILPYLLDFAIKLLNRFPSKGWAGIFQEGKLFSPEKPISLSQYIMKFSGGVSEPNLVSFFVFLEFFFGLLTLFIFYLR
jgi:UDP-N-acetylglucosamine--dolichyl-phosphate N-acetylglucosaminephosphotransferase